MAALINRFPLKHRPLISLLYLTGARIGEVWRYDRATKREEGIRGCDFYVKKADGREFIVVEIPTEKNLVKVRRRVPIPVEDELPIARWLLKLKDKGAFTRSSFGIVFRQESMKPWSWHRRVQELFDEHLKGFYSKASPHWLRHCRTTHLIEHYGVKDMERLRNCMGWSDYRPLTTYAHLMDEDIAAEMVAKKE
jgi:integrase